eukprot:PhM_4_TR11848/c0_g1_i2/m.11834/K15296/NAPA, SNAPA, SEC17; alpha-soluble NSF attachment protein
MSDLMKQADGKLKGFMSMFNSAKYEEAQELYQRAGARFKAEKDWMNAGDAFMRAGDCAQKSSSPYECCTNYSEAGSCFRKAGDPKKAQMCFDQAIQMFIESNRFPNAARLEKECGEMYEEAADTEQALAHYEKAVRYFTTDEGSKVQAFNVMQKIAMIEADRGNQAKAVSLFEQLASESLAGPLKSQAREHFFKAALLRIAMIQRINISEGVAELREAMDSYTTLDTSLRSSREAELVSGIADAIEASMPDLVREAVQKYSEVKPLDDWKVHLVYHAVEIIEVEDER